MIEIREATVDEMLSNAGQLFAAHWDEIALNKQVMVLKPDEARYRAMEASGGLLILGAFIDGELAGYSVNFVIHHLHYADLCVCSNDLLFIAKPHREGGVGIRLMRRTEEVARERGARLVLWHAKPTRRSPRFCPAWATACRTSSFRKRSDMGVTAAVAAVIGTSYAVYSGERAASAQDDANKKAEQNAKTQADQADQAVNRANGKRPNIGAMLAANQQAAKGGQSGTMLTGPAGIDPNVLNLSKNTLLGG